MKKYGKRLRLSKEEVEMVYENRAESTTNINGNTALDIHLSERGIKKDDVVVLSIGNLLVVSTDLAL